MDLSAGSSAPFSDDLSQAADEVWEAMHEHAFVRGIGDGTLAPERFRFYVRQDYLFLIDYGRLLALGCARAPRLDVMVSFAELTRSILVTEMDLHRAYAADWHISSEQLQREPAHPTTRLTDFLLRTATLGDFGELVAALLPCMWGYSELGLRLAESGPPSEARYARWIEMYSTEDFAELARWCPEICDEAAADASERTRARMQAAFLTSSRHELAFWESAWRSTP